MKLQEIKIIRDFGIVDIAKGAIRFEAENRTPIQWYQIASLITSSLIGLTCGLCFAWSSPSIPKLTQDEDLYDISLEEASYLTIIPWVGGLSVSLLCCWTMDTIGRKYILLFTAIPYTASWILIAFARSIYVIYVARVLTGVGDCIFLITLPAYIGEISSPKIRGTWGNAMSFCIYLGQFLINVIGGYASIKITALICVSVPIIFACTFIFMPESPYFLIMKGRYEQAKQSLKKLRRGLDLEKEFTIVKGDVERQMSETGTWKDLFMIASNRKAVYSVIFLRASQQFTGMTAFNGYTNYIFQEAGGNLDSTTSTIIVTMVFALSSFCGGFTVDKLGRKKSYLYSLLICGMILVIEGTYFFLDKNVEGIDMTFLNWIPLVGMMLFSISYSLGAGIVPTLMSGELFSASVKAKGMCLSFIIFGILLSTISKLFQVLESNFGLYCPFYIFAFGCFASAILTIKLVPETRGKTLEEIQQDFKANKQSKPDSELNEK